MSALIDQFLGYLDGERGCSPQTLRAYAADLAALANFAAPDSDFQPTAMTTLQLRHYLARLRQDGAARTTIARKVASMRSFYRFLMREGVVSHNPASNLTVPRREKRLPLFLDEAEVEPSGSRPYATVALAAATIGTIWLGVAPTPVLDAAARAFEVVVLGP